MEILLKRVLLVTLLCFSLAYEDLEVGSQCRSSGSTGVCVKVQDCPEAIESLRKIYRHYLKRCGFIRKDEIVCCPSVNNKGGIDGDTHGIDSTEETTPITDSKGQFPQKRKYQKACEEVAAESKTNIIFHITEGEDAQEKEFPHMAALGFENDDMDELDWRCGACIISKNFLLTAAHCVIRSNPLKARVGITWLNDTNPQDIDIKKVTMHDSYDALSKHGDIALIELASNITFSEKAKPACLYGGTDDPLGLIVTGWGKTSITTEDDRSVILQKAKLVPVSTEKCNATYARTSLGTKTIESTQICAHGGASDACWGDSGGPLQIRDRSGAFSIIGIVSYGAGCGGKIPGVYTRVSSYIDWIESVVWP